MVNRLTLNCFRCKHRGWQFSNSAA